MSRAYQDRTKRVCPYCGHKAKSKFRFHLYKKHATECLNERQLILDIEGLSTWPICSICNKNELTYDLAKFKFNKYCKTCKSKLNLKYLIESNFHQGMLGKHQSDEAKKKQSLNNIGKHKGWNPNLNTYKWIIGKSGRWKSRIEVKLITWMKSLNYDVLDDVLLELPDRKVQVDALIKFGNSYIVFEIDGKLYHDLNKDISRDKLIYENLGYKTLRLDSHLCYQIFESNDNIKLFNLINYVQEHEPYFDLFKSELDILNWKSGVVHV